MPLLVSLTNDVWEKSVKVPYWWYVTEANFPCGMTNHQKHCEIWVVTRHQYGFSALVSEMSFHRETSDSFAKCSEINAKSCICFTTELKIKHQSFCTTAESSCYCWLLTTLQWNLSVSGTFQHICSNSECKRCLSAEFSSCKISQHQSPGIEKQKDLAMGVSLKFSREWK